MPRRPSEVLGIEDQTEALLLDLAFVSRMMPEEKKLKKPRSVAERIRRKRRGLPITRYRV